MDDVCSIGRVYKWLWLFWVKKKLWGREVNEWNESFPHLAPLLTQKHPTLSIFHFILLFFHLLKVFCLIIPILLARLMPQQKWVYSRVICAWNHNWTSQATMFILLFCLIHNLKKISSKGILSTCNGIDNQSRYNVNVKYLDRQTYK